MAPITWGARQSPTASTLLSVAYGAGRWVAVGYGGTVLTSPDGVTWTQQTGVSSSALYDVMWDGERFYAVGAGATNLRSPDGITWTPWGGDPSGVLRSVAAYGTVRVIGGDDGLWTSDAVGLPVKSANRWARGVTHGGGMFVTVGADIQWSPTGTSWNYQPGGGVQLNDVAYGNGTFVAVGQNGRVRTSPDGGTWTTRPDLGTSNLLSVTFIGGRFLATALDGTTWESTNGTSWTVAAPSAGGAIYGIANNGTQLVAVGAGGLILGSNVPPYAPTLLAPANDELIDRSQPQVFRIGFNDPDPGDSMSALRVRARPEGGSAWTVDTAWVATPTPRHEFPAGTFTEGRWQWQAATKDALGFEGPFSPSGFYDVGTSPDAPSITAPANGATIPLASTVLSWSTPDQDAYQVQVRDGATVLWDTGTGTSSTARSWTVTLPDNDVTRVLAVRIMVGGLWSTWRETTIQVSYTTPPTPTVVIDPLVTPGSPHPNQPDSLRIIPSFPTPAANQPAVESWEVWVRGGPEGHVRLATNLPPGQPWTWHVPASGVNYEAQVIATGSNGTQARSDWTGGA